MHAYIAARSHAFRKIEPQLRMGSAGLTAGVRRAVFFAHIGKDGSPQFPVYETDGQCREVNWKRRHVMVVVQGILPQIVSRQLAYGPRFVEGMAKQVIFRDARIQLFEEFLVSHEAPLPAEVNTISERLGGDKLRRTRHEITCRIKSQVR